MLSGVGLMDSWSVVGIKEFFFFTLAFLFHLI